MLGRIVERLMDRHGLSYPFASSSDILKAADLVVANFEGAIPATHVPTPLSSLRFSFRPETAEALAAYGVKIVTLGNNHALDFGEEGYEHTKEVLRSAGIASAGHPSHPDASTIYFVLRGRPFVVVSLNDTWGTLDAETAAEAVRKASVSGAYGQRFVVVSIHWGEEYAFEANRRQRELARSFADAGADLVVGHHPHVIQDIERIGTTLVLYSLGNFIFDQYFSEETQEGLAATVTFRDEDVFIDLIPLASKLSQPRPLHAIDRVSRLRALAARSSPDLFSEIEKGSLRIQRK